METCVLTACSNPLDSARRQYVRHLSRTLEGLGLEVQQSRYLLSHGNEATPEEKASELNELFSEPGISRIYDMSGGDVAHELLPFLDYEAIGRSEADFYGYSDLTVIHNAIYAKTGKTGVLWSPMNLLRSDSEGQKARFDKPDMFRFQTEFLQGNHMEGTVLGGNTRCFLKLAGTPYFPDLTGKILLLEARSGDEQQILAYFARLDLLGVFEQVSGMILGTFSQLERGGISPWDLLRGKLPKDLSVAKTAEIGHGPKSRAVRIGGIYQLDLAEGQGIPL